MFLDTLSYPNIKNMKKLKYPTPIYNFYILLKKLPIPKFPYILCLSI